MERDTILEIASWVRRGGYLFIGNNAMRVDKCGHQNKIDIIMPYESSDTKRLGQGTIRVSRAPMDTMQEWELLGISSDYSGSDPLDLMIAAEEGGLDHLIDEYY